MKDSKIEGIMKLSSELNTVQDLDILLERIITEARKILSADGGSIQIRDGDELIFSHVQTDSLQRKLSPGQKLIHTTFRTKIDESSLSGYAAMSGEILKHDDVYDIPQDAPYKFNRSYDQRSNYRTKSMLTIPLKDNRGFVLGVMQIVNAIVLHDYKCELDEIKGIGPFSKDDELIALHFANIASMILQRAQMTRALILRMISMAELRDPKETGSHVNRVASYSVEIYESWAVRRGYDRHEIDRNRDVLRMAAMLHDVGKVAITDTILKKPAKFTIEEFEIMKGHTYHGARLFKYRQSDFDEISSQVALTHHENWDGTGYPGHVDIETGKSIERNRSGLKGEEIPLYGRIVSLADVYDALMSKRVYKEAWDEKNVLDEIRLQSGKKFDPEIVDIFFDNYEMIRSIAGRYPDAG
jgi:HD-GYP domain-containing protein (c-di-GMP phosphodiesterase class II)